MSRKFSRRSLLKATGVAVAGAFAAPYILRAAPLNKQKLRIAFVGTGGQAGAHIGLAQSESCPCYADIDPTHWDKIAGMAPQAKQYTDWREMFDKHEKEIDAVVVTTPDHTHAYASMRALKAGKGCYTEKPLTWSIPEARALAKVTAEMKLPTQMGNMGHDSDANRSTVEYVRSGCIGDIVEIHSWTGRPVWPQGPDALRAKSAAVPKGLNWDVWCGPGPLREYSPDIHPFKWRGWVDYGCGAVGDMGCHTWDAPFWAMDPDYPTVVELVEVDGAAKGVFPRRTHFKWTFPAKGNRPGYTAHWYSGGMKPPTPDEYGDFVGGAASKGKKIDLTGSGSLYVGTKGKMICIGDYGGNPNLLPKPAGFTPPPKTIPRSPGHKNEWLMACKGDKPWDFPASNFTYGGALTEVLLLGAMTERIGEKGTKIECDAVKREVLTQAAKDLMSREPRKGFSL